MKNKKRKKYSLARYLFKNYLEKEERIKYIVRPHPFTYHMKFSSIKLLFFFVPLLIFIFIPQYKTIGFILVAIGLIKTFLVYFDWNYNVWLVTNKGVISIRAKSIWHRHQARVEHDMIAGISYEIKGFVGAMINLGHITLEKAGSSVDIMKFEKIYNPRKAEHNIVKCQKAYIQKKSKIKREGLLETMSQKLNYA